MVATMVRTQIQLSERQSKLLKRLAAERDESIAEVIRQAIDMYVGASDKPQPEELKRRAIAAVGKFRSGKRDISAKHDKYLAEDFR
jgi:hypothetical protein